MPCAACLQPPSACKPSDATLECVRLGVLAALETTEFNDQTSRLARHQANVTAR
jgi:hypothetical protein